MARIFLWTIAKQRFYRKVLWISQLVLLSSLNDKGFSEFFAAAKKQISTACCAGMP
jgi:hypothetical protein